MCNRWVKCPIQYRGRPCAAAPATGNKLQHLRELHNFVVSIFGELTEAEKEAIKKENERSMAQAKALAAEKAKEMKKLNENKKSADDKSKSPNKPATSGDSGSPKPNKPTDKKK